MNGKGRARRTPVQVVDELEEWLRTRIGDVAEDDWLSLDDFDGSCESVRRQWAFANAVSLANPDVKQVLHSRCSLNLRRARTAFQVLVLAWVSRKEP
jgi:hypothetical protein